MSTPTLTALVRAEAFLAGFENDETQEGIGDDLAIIRSAIAGHAAIEACARALLAAVDFDNNGNMVGMVRMGGNGGLISLDTTRAADQLRLVLNRCGAN